MARIRKNVWDPAAANDVDWYGRVVAAMAQKPIADPTSWRYQAAIHEYISGQDPLAIATDVLPADADQATFWTQCQHGSFYFLPWHRMYLHYFETMLMAEIQRQNGPTDWALPYWNYSKDEASRLLPPAFRSATLADGTANSLFVAARAPGCNSGEPFADAHDTDLSVCLTEPVFDGSSFGGAPSFGGPVTQFQHGGGVQGALEQTPHGTMHVSVGGDSGWMSAFNTAALDPIFWLHHANIDRLWQVWLKRDGTHSNPVNAGWLSSVSFPFHDASGQVVTMTPSQVLDSTAAPLSYDYDDTSDPLASPAVAARVLARGIMPKKPPPEMIGATEGPLDLDDTTVHAAFTVQAPRAPASAVTENARPGDHRRRVFLNIENLTSSTRAPAYDVYMNVPNGADPREHARLHVGRIPMFGLVEASRADTKHPGSGLHYVLDVTDLYARLSAAPGWNPDHVRVSFVATRKQAGAKVRVGRVSLYVE